MPEYSSCRVCNRRLTNPASIAVSMGPVCSKRYGIIFEEALAYATSLGRQLDVGIIQAQATIAAHLAYRERIARVRRQEPAPSTVPQDQTISAWSATRGQAEELRVEFSDEQHAVVRSVSGNAYDVTNDSCTCPAHRFRRSESSVPCRHIEAYRTAVQNSRGTSRTQLPEGEDGSNRTRVRALIDRAVHEQAFWTFQQRNWEVEEERDGVLQVWTRNRGFDGIYVSEDDEVWENLLHQANQDWDYKYDNVLGGTGNSFGIEIEFELPRNVDKREAAEVLYDAGLIDRRGVSFYHANNAGPGMWRLESDGSLSHGLELVSPVLFDRRDSWQQIEVATKKLRELGAYTNEDTGGHIHLGIAPLDHRAYSYQRLARIGVAYERLFYRMGGADADSYANRNQPGSHRGSYYASPLPSSVNNITGTLTGQQARRYLSNNERYTIFNVTNVDASSGRKPTIEMRYPNGTLNHKQWQAQIQVANSVVHQAAVIRNESPQNAFTPRFNQRDQHLRHADSCSSQMETDQFRRFLDVLGNPQDRLAATWLYLRGRA